LGVIILGLGLSLQIADFTRAPRFPKAVAVGLAGWSAGTDPGPTLSRS
jgi:predicted Na+-dependent transporter